jgi:hypothetical protein
MLRPVYKSISRYMHFLSYYFLEENRRKRNRIINFDNHWLLTPLKFVLNLLVISILAIAPYLFDLKRLVEIANTLLMLSFWYLNLFLP